ncbi:MAG: S16 family serine protease [Ruminococcus callidus]
MVNGLAWTSVGGVLMPMEVLATPARDSGVHRFWRCDAESAKIAVSYAQRRSQV